MTEQKQIEEMAKDIARKIAWDEDEIPTVNCLETAKCLYTAGWRKQIVGEWIEVETIDDGWTRYRCNGCGWDTESYYKEKYDLHRYCPNCGSRMMKGEQ